MPVYRRLFTITRDDNRNHLPTTGRVPPSLQSLTKDVLLQSLANVFRGKSASWYPDQIWRDERWIQLKGYLHQLPLNVLQDIFEEVDSFNENHDDDCQVCEEKHRPHWMVSLNQRSFYVWWLFFDEKQTKELRTKFFSRETMEEYLSSVPTGLTFINPAYRVWSERFCQNQSQVREMSFEKWNPVSIMTKDRCSRFLSLHSLKVFDDFQLHFDNVKTFFRILTSQKHSLKELIMENTLMYDSKDPFNRKKFSSEKLWRVLAELTLLSRIHLNEWHWQWMMKHQVNIFEIFILLLQSQLNHHVS